MNVLMVCLGNICRSPLAHGILESKAPENWYIDSAGTSVGTKVSDLILDLSLRQKAAD